MVVQLYKFRSTAKVHYVVLYMVHHIVHYMVRHIVHHIDGTLGVASALITMLCACYA